MVRRKLTAVAAAATVFHLCVAADARARACGSAACLRETIKLCLFARDEGLLYDFTVKFIFISYLFANHFFRFTIGPTTCDRGGGGVVRHVGSFNFLLAVFRCDVTNTHVVATRGNVSWANDFSA